MLSLQMKSGDYVTIGNNVVIQIFRESGPQFRISIKAPREIPIVRGEVLERNGEARPEGVLPKPPKKCPSDQIHSARRFQKRAEQLEYRKRAEEAQAAALAEMRGILGRMETDRSSTQKEIEALRLQLDRIAEASRPWEGGAGSNGGKDA